MPRALADVFILRLIENGLVPANVSHVIIDAKQGEITKLHYTVYEMDEDILKALAPKVDEAKVELKYG